jgi:hypothetical protein
MARAAWVLAIISAFLIAVGRSRQAAAGRDRRLRSARIGGSPVSVGTADRIEPAPADSLAATR